MRDIRPPMGETQGAPPPAPRHSPFGSFSHVWLEGIQVWEVRIVCQEKYLTNLRFHSNKT
jgi:hypothetical protein